MQWNKAIQLIWSGVFLVIAVIGTWAASHYAGSTWVYVLFTVLSSAVLICGFGPKAIFFDAFIGVLLWIGFWLKFSVRTAFFDGQFVIEVGAFDGSAKSLDQALLVVCCALAAILAARGVRQWLFVYPSELPEIAHRSLFTFYQQHRVKLLALFLFAIVAVCTSNALFGIYQRGQVPRVQLPFGLNGIYAWLLMFGMATASAVILRFEFQINRQRYWIALAIALFETAMSNVSLWSRGMILNGSALIYGVLVQARRKGEPLPLKLGAGIMVAFAAFFLASVLMVNALRATTFYADAPPAEKQELLVKQTSVLFLDRWVGIEGVMSVVCKPDKGWPLLSQALEETLNHDRNSFYDDHFIQTHYDNANSGDLHFISLPGYVAFLYYPGSFVFLFAAVFLFSAVAAALEYLVYRLGGNNLVLCALIAQVIAYRYTSFGYVPQQSYLLFGAIVLNVLLLFFFDRLLRFSNKTNQQQGG